jgi:nitrogen fixation NifU-like protein
VIGAGWFTQKTVEEVRMGIRPDKSEFDEAVRQIQVWVTQEERALYSEEVIDEYHHPNNVGRMGTPDGIGVIHGWCGDTMEIFLKVSGRTIAEATFLTDGCGPTVACGSRITTMVQNMSMEQASEISKEDLLNALNGLPEESLHCAELAVNTLHVAIASVSA